MARLRRVDAMERLVRRTRSQPAPISSFDSVYSVFILSSSLTNCHAFVSSLHQSPLDRSCLVLWDGLHKKKLTTLPQFPTSIAAMAFHPTGTELAIASSYTFEEGEREHPHDEIYVRQILDAECMPKSK